VSPKSLPVLIRRLMESGDDQAESLAEISWLRVGWERKALICRPTI
jgi:hypothetical protein